MSYDLLIPSAAKLWAYAPDWTNGFNVRRAFKTDIVTSRDNHEQRRSLRDAPRLGLDYRTVQSGEQLRQAKDWLRAYQNRPAIVPDFARWSRLTAASTSGATTLTVSPMPPWVGPGQFLVLCGATTEVVEVASVAGTTITLADPLAAAWSLGAVIRPAFHGLLAATMKGSRYTPGAVEIEVSLDAYPGGEPPRAAGTAWATLNGRDIFTLDPDYAGRPSIDTVWPVEQVDVERGRTAQFRPIDWAETLTEAEFKGLSPSQAVQLEQFFDRMRGRRGSFFLPTGEQDIRLAASAAGSSSFAAEGTILAAAYASHDFAAEPIGVAACLADGSWVYRAITSVAAGVATSQFHVGAALPAGFTLANVKRVSLMPLVRFASDEMTMTWQTPLSAKARLSFQSVKR